MKKTLAVAAIALLIFGCRQKTKDKDFTAEDISNVIAQMTGIMVHDVTNPPLSARFFSYACLSGYEVVAQNNGKIRRWRFRESAGANRRHR